MHVIRFGSTDDLAPEYSVALVPTVETDAITMIPPEKLATSIVEPGGNTQGTLYIDLNLGSLTNVKVRFYDSYLGLPTAADWYQEVVETDTSGVGTLDPFVVTLTASARIAYHFPIGATQAMKITVQGTGTQTGATLKLNAALRSN